MLIAIKLLHTFIWAVLAGCILALPVLGLARRFRWAVILSLVIWMECLVLALNGGACPLTGWAARFTTDRSHNFDIYLPLWLAQYNKVIFGSLFLAGELVIAASWLWSRPWRHIGAASASRARRPEGGATKSKFEIQN